MSLHFPSSLGFSNWSCAVSSSFFFTSAKQINFHHIENILKSTLYYTGKKTAFPLCTLVIFYLIRTYFFAIHVDIETTQRKDVWVCLLVTFLSYSPEYYVPGNLQRYYYNLHLQTILLKHKQVKWLAQSHRAGEWQSHSLDAEWWTLPFPISPCQITLSASSHFPPSVLLRVNLIFYLIGKRNKSKLSDQTSSTFCHQACKITPAV